MTGCVSLRRLTQEISKKLCSRTVNSVANTLQPACEANHGEQHTLDDTYIRVGIWHSGQQICAAFR